MAAARLGCEEATTSEPGELWAQASEDSLSVAEVGGSILFGLDPTACARKHSSDGKPAIIDSFYDVVCVTPSSSNLSRTRTGNEIGRIGREYEQA